MSIMKTIGASLARFFSANGMAVTKDGQVLSAAIIEELTASADVSDMVADALHSQLAAQAAANDQIVKDNGALKATIAALEGKITAIEKGLATIQAEQVETVKAATTANTSAVAALEQAKANADYINKQQGKTPVFEQNLADAENPMLAGNEQPLPIYGTQSEERAAEMAKMRESQKKAIQAKQNLK